MLSPTAMLWGFVLPAALVAAALIIGWQPWRAAEHNARWLAAPAIAAGFAIAFWHLQSPPVYPPGTGDAVSWLFYFAISIALLGLLEGILRPPLWLRAILLVILWRLAVRALLSRLIPRVISESDAEAWIDAAVLAALIWWLAIESLAARAPGPTVPLIFAILATAFAVTLVTWHIIRSGTLVGALGAMSGAAAVISLWDRRISFSAGGVTAFALLVLALATHAYFYTDDTFTPAQNARTALMLLSPLLAFAGDLPGIRSQKPLLRLAARLLPLLLVAGAVTGLGLRDYLRAEAQSHAAQQDE
jgi:hypothetical protein